MKCLKCLIGFLILICPGSICQDDLPRDQNSVAIGAVTTDESEVQAFFSRLAQSHNAGEWDEFVKLVSSDWKKRYYYRSFHLAEIGAEDIRRDFDLATGKWQKRFREYCSSLELNSLDDLLDAFLRFEQHDEYLEAILEFSSRFPRPYYKPKLKNVVVEGTRARALAVFETNKGLLALISAQSQKNIEAGSLEIFFVKYRERWLLSTLDEWSSISFSNSR